MSCYVKVILAFAQTIQKNMRHNDPLADRDLVPTSASWVFQESSKLSSVNKRRVCQV